PERERALALAQPTAVCFAPDGARLFVAAFASDRIAVLDRDGAVTARLELAPDPAHRDPRAMRGPRALAHHPSAPVLYVLNRLAGTVAAIDTATLAVASEVSIGADPTPRWLAEGRGFVQSAWLSGTGLAACGSCHLDGDWDGLAWDLGDPHGAMATVPNKSLYPLRMHPMKGPMKTQSLRGLTPDAGPFHHRGDRPSLRDFNASFDTLLGGTPLAEPDLTTAVRYLQSLRYPPNPHRALEDHEDERGGALFVQPFQGAASCKTCHFGAAGTSGLIMSGHLLQYQPQPMKVGQLRDAYKRTARIAENGRRRGGFGLLHDGSIDRVASFLARPFFRGFAHSPEARAGLERTVLAFDTGTPPAVGWAMTVASPDDARLAELEIVEQLARSGRCELVAFGRTGGAARRWTFDAETARYRGDGRDAMRSELLAELDPADGDAITFLGRPSF
ncbi:MAG: beta-propeller fold lactonase family protein, partial [Planctomycetes bacterium]|nr:beta-propeller fold lactonase family protein [Planctomycetota bacterium]